MLEIASLPRIGRSNSKLLFMDRGEVSHHTVADLPQFIPSNSLLVVNDAATIPASFLGFAGSLPIELRLVHNLDPSYDTVSNWEAILFYEGNWKLRTEDRLDPDFLEIGDFLEFGELKAEVISIDHPSKRLIKVRFIGTFDGIWEKFYKYGKPIQYAHLREELALWDVQTIFASRPVAIEAPSAAFQLTWDLIAELEKKGVTVVSLTHAAGISSTGLAEMDAQLPLTESYWISEQTAEIINSFKNNDRPIIALGTSVTRALESNYSDFGAIVSGQYTTSLVISAKYKRKLVRGLLTGMHLPDESHMQLLLNFVSKSFLSKAYNEAERLDYQWHEYGDGALIIT